MSHENTIWLIWWQGRGRINEISEICIETWRKLNSNWNLVILDKNNIHEYIDSSTLDFYSKVRPVQPFCDLIRLHLLYKYGGLYIDTTMFCNKPLDDWINRSSFRGKFFVQYDHQQKFCCPSVNFLYTKNKGNRLFNVLPEEVDRLLVQNSKLRWNCTHRYHSVNHKIFREKMRPYSQFFLKKQLKDFGLTCNHWNGNKTGFKILANQWMNMQKKVDEEFLQTLRVFPYFKLGWKLPKGWKNKMGDRSRLRYLLNM